MRSVGGVAWNRDSATCAARSALARAGSVSNSLGLLRFGGSAVFRADELVVRVAPELTSLEAAMAATRLASWLDREGVPTARPAGTSADTQIVGDATVSLWQWEGALDARLPGAIHGSMLRDLHQRLDAYEGALPRSSCLFEAERRLRLAAAHPLLADEGGSLQQAFQHLVSQLSTTKPDRKSVV